MLGSNFNPKVIQEKCKKAGIEYWISTQAIMAVREKVKPGMTEDEIDDLVIEELRRIDEASARAYENFHKIYVRTSNGELEPFDKEKIIESLLRETTLPKNTCEEIADEVESDIRRLELRYISAPLIRDIVNSKLLERKYSRARQEYTRLGLPIYDVHKMITNPSIKPRNPEAIQKVFGDSIAEEYALVKLIPEEVAKAHLSGFIHIHDLPYFATKAISLQNDLRWFLEKGLFIDEDTALAGPPKHADTAFSHATRILISASTHISGGQGFDMFNLFMAPFTYSINSSELTQMIQGFLYEINQLQGVNGGRLPLASLGFELEAPQFIKKERAILPGGMKSTDTYLDYEREGIRILNSFLDVMTAGDFSGKPFKVPRVVIKIRDGPIPSSTLERLEKFLKAGNKVTIVNHRELSPRTNLALIAPNHIIPGKRRSWFETLRTGVVQETSINMPYIGLKAKDEVMFFSMLEDALKKAKEISSIKRNLVEKAMFESKILPFFVQGDEDNPYFQLDYSISLVNLVGLESAIHAFKGLNVIRDEDGFLFAEKVLSFVKNKLQGFRENEGVQIYLANLETEKVRERFSRLNYKNFGIKDIYYNTHTFGSDLIQWMKVEKELQENSEGGNFFEVSLERFAKEKKVEPSIKLVYDILDLAPRVFTLSW